MAISFVLVAFCFLIFLFFLYSQSVDDFMLLRKNIPIEKVFDLAAFTILAGLFFARLLFVSTHYITLLFNPLVFLAFPRFPGFSLVGGVVGGVLGILYYCLSKKFPLGRLFDFFSTSFLFALSCGLFFDAVFSIFKKHLNLLELVLAFVYLMLGSFLYFLLGRSRLKDGSVGLFTLFAFSIISLLSFFASGGKQLVTAENALLVALSITSLVLIIRAENFKILQLRPK